MNRNRALRTKIVSARVDEETYEKLAKQARDQELLIGELLRRIIEDSE